jgi:hypothetical protein
MEGLWVMKLQAQGQVRILFNITANYRMVFKAILKQIKAILKHFKVILKQIKAILKHFKAGYRYKSRGYGDTPPLYNENKLENGVFGAW